MEIISIFIVYIIMACATAGAFAAIKNADEGLGKRG